MTRADLRHSRSTRLALALLALAGFAAPAPERECDGVVETAQDSRAARPARAARAAPASAELVALVETLPAPPLPHLERALTERAVPGARRYLLHRAWLL